MRGPGEETVAPRTLTPPVSWVAERRSAGPGALDALVACAQAGDMRAFREVTETLGPPLERFVTRYLRGDADTASDVVQDTFIAAWRKLHTIQDGSHLRPWLYRVARYKAISWLRRRGPRGVTMDSVEVSLELGHEVADRRGSLAGRACASSFERLREAIARLPPLYAGAIRLHYLHGHDTRTTAELLGVPRTTVKMRLHRGRKKLRALMEERASQR